MTWTPPNFWEILISLVFTGVSAWVGAWLALRGERANSVRHRLSEDQARGRALTGEMLKKLDLPLWGMISMAGELGLSEPGGEIAIRDESVDALRAAVAKIDLPESQRPVTDWVSRQVESFSTKVLTLNAGPRALAQHEATKLKEAIEDALSAYQDARRDETWFLTH